MTLSFLSNLGGPVGAGDWYMLIMLISFLLSLFVMGSYTGSYLQGLSVMYRFNSPDADIHYPLFSPSGKIVVVLISCIDIGLGLSLFLLDPTEQGVVMVSWILAVSAIPLLFFLLKIALYQIVNTSLYRSQTTMLKTSRWNGFFIMVFSASAFCVLVMTAITLFLGLRPSILVVFISIILILAETGMFFKIKTSLFKNRCSISRFILYLCALELGPIILMLVLLWVIIS